MNLCMMILAQATAPSTTTSEPPGSGFLQFLPIVAIGLLFYFFVVRSKKGQDKQRQSMLDTLKRGDRIQTIGGIIGTVVEAREKEVIVKVDESSNTKMRFTRAAIHKVVTDDDKDEAKKD